MSIWKDEDFWFLAFKFFFERVISGGLVASIDPLKKKEKKDEDPILPKSQGGAEEQKKT